MNAAFDRWMSGSFQLLSEGQVAERRKRDRRPIRWCIVDDAEAVRQAAKLVLEAGAGFRCVGAFADGSSAVASIPDLKPDVVIMDLLMPGMTAFEAVCRLKAALPEVKIVVATAVQDRDMFLKFLALGIHGYLLKPMTADELVQAVRDGSAGILRLDPRLGAWLLDALRGRAMSALPVLTPRESQILALLDEGKGAKRIADVLKVSVSTVNRHEANIHVKWNVHNRVEVLNLYRQSKAINP